MVWLFHLKKIDFFNIFYWNIQLLFSNQNKRMSHKLTKLFIDFTSDIVSNNSSFEFDQFKKILMNKDVKQQIDGFFKDNKIKQKKDKKDTSDEPKKPRSSYIIFCSHERESILEKNPDASSKEITSLLGKRWKDIQISDIDTFERYNEMAKKEKDDYEERMKEYRILHNLPEKIEKVKKPKVIKPEKPMSPFYYYLKDMEAKISDENPGMKKKEIHEKIKATWKELKDEKDDIVDKYKKIAINKKKELNSVVNSSVQTSPVRVPATPGSFINNSVSNSPIIVVSNNNEEEEKKEKPKKKKKKNTEDKPKKKKIIRKVLDMDEENDLEDDD